MARLGLADGTLDEHVARVEAVKRAAAGAGRTVAMLADLPDPRLRAAPFPEEGVSPGEDAVVTLAADDTGSSVEGIEVDYPDLLNDLRPGDQLALGDGAALLRVEE